MKNLIATPRMDNLFDPEFMATMLKTSAEDLKPVERVPRTTVPIVALDEPDAAQIARREPGLRVPCLGHSMVLVLQTTRAVREGLSTPLPMARSRVSEQRAIETGS